MVEKVDGKPVDYSRLPDHIQKSMKLYIEKGILPGDFLKAVLSNNFIKAVGLADPICFTHLGNIAQFLYNNVPQECYGSEKKMMKWADERFQEYTKSKS